MTDRLATSPQRDESEPALAEKVVSIHRQLDAAKIPHAIGGALALAYYAEPRATVDVDINVFVSTDRWPEIRTALQALGVDVSADSAALERDGQVRLWWGRNAVDLFFSYDDLHEEMSKRSRRVPFGDTTLQILSPEHLAVCKAMFDRVKDWIDIEQILVATDPIDLAEIEAELTRMVGASDPRIAKLEEIKVRLSLDGSAA
ncbi:MAG TPA: nucleotidyl transferase AbiEii/AbiGii toxin family protein [Solirubrobacterales bacterium]|nr:nucleotidyl transferase AbiEii/AbiGii toxin family protein [Solirubrobacterales bacterium]